MDATPDSGSPEQQLEQLRDRLAEERTWTGWLRSLPTPARVLACLLLIAIPASAVVLLVGRSDFRAYPAPLMVVCLLLLGTLAVLSVRMFLWPLHKREPGIAATGIWMLLGLGFPVVLALMPEAHGLTHEHPESFVGQGADFWPRAAACLVFGVACSLPLLWMLAVSDRRDRVRGGRAVFAAAAAGLAGNLILLLHCPLVTRGHLLAGHASIGFAVLLPRLLAAWLRGRRS